MGYMVIDNNPYSDSPFYFSVKDREDIGKIKIKNGDNVRSLFVYESIAEMIDDLNKGYGMGGMTVTFDEVTNKIKVSDPEYDNIIFVEI